MIVSPLVLPSSAWNRWIYGTLTFSLWEEIHAAFLDPDPSVEA